MSEVITPLKQLLAGQTFTADEDGAFVITERHTHSDILRFVVADLGLSAAIFILRNLTEQHQPTQSDTHNIARDGVDIVRALQELSK